MIKFTLLFMTVIFFSACSKNFYIAPMEQFNITDTTQFRYKNSITKNLYLPQNITTCVLDKTNKFVNTKKSLEDFIRLNWKDKATLKENCIGVDFYLRLNTTKDLIYKKGDSQQYYLALKLNILQRKGKKIVADYTIKNGRWTIDDRDMQIVIKQFTPIYLTNKKIFGE